MQSWRGAGLAVLLTVSSTVILFAASGHGQTKPLPEGHPPTGRQAPGPAQVPRMSIVAPPADSGTGSRALVWKTPTGWVTEAPSSQMRRGQYRIQGPGGPAECVVFYFGPGQGGDAASNVARWAAQFTRRDGSPIGDALRRRELKVGDIPVVTVEVAGTYVGGMGGMPAGPARPDHMLLGAIAEGPDARWYFRAVGPRKTLAPQRAAFDRMIRSIKRGTAAK